MRAGLLVTWSLSLTLLASVDSFVLLQQRYGSFKDMDPLAGFVDADLLLPYSAAISIAECLRRAVFLDCLSDSSPSER